MAPEIGPRSFGTLEKESPWGAYPESPRNLMGLRTIDFKEKRHSCGRKTQYISDRSPVISVFFFNFKAINSKISNAGETQKN